MSERNGDKARFSRERKKKLLLRQRIRELRKALGLLNETREPTSAGLLSGDNSHLIYSIRPRELTPISSLRWISIRRV